MLVSGPVGDHGIAVMLAREEFDLSGAVRSDCAAVTPLTAPLRGRSTACASCAIRPAAGLRPWRTRSPPEPASTCGLSKTGFRCAIRCVRSARCSATIPIIWPARGGSSPSPRREAADEILTTWRGLAGGEAASVIGTMTRGRGRVVLETEIGGERFLEELEDDPLPRIC